MALSVKILEKGAGTKSRTATASLGGLITSEDTGYTGTNCTIAIYTPSTHFWKATGTASTAMAMNYDTTVACATGKKVFIRATLATETANVDSISCYVAGTTGGSASAMTVSNPTANQYYTVSGIVTMNASYTGNIRLRWLLADAGGVTGSVLIITNWQAIDLTAEFGAGSEPSAADLDAFYAWRCVGTYANYGMYNSSGDSFYFASKIASHGLEYNDVVNIPSASATFEWSNVFALNSDWIITSNYPLDSRGTASTTINYWTKVDYTSRLLAKSLNMTVRTDIDGSVSLALRGDSTWKPQLGMTVFVYDGTEELFCGHISQNNITELNSSNFRCDCVISSLLTQLQWGYIRTGRATLKAFANTREAVDYLIFRQANFDGTAGFGGQCFWRGAIDTGNTTIDINNPEYRSLYDIVNSLCKSAGMVLTVSGDRRISAQYQTMTQTYAPREITDAVAPQIWNVRYTEDINNFANLVYLAGGYLDSGAQAFGSATVTNPISNDIFAGAANKGIIITDSTVCNATDADAAANYYALRVGKSMPGELSFTTTDNDYRPNQRAVVQLSTLGMTASVGMHIDSVTIYDVDGVNLISNVVMSRRDATDFAVAPNQGSTSVLTTLASTVSSAVSNLSQTADTFTPALQGSGTAGTWAWTTQEGWYIRIGNMCYVSIVLTPSSISGSPTNNLLLTGLPFTVAAVNGQVLDVLASGVNWGTSMSDIKVLLTASATTGTFYGAGNNVAQAAVPVGNIVATDNLRISGWYQCI